MAFVSFQDGEVLEQVLSLEQINIENCRVTLTRAKKKEDGGVNLNARDVTAEAAQASDTPRATLAASASRSRGVRGAGDPPRQEK